MSLNRLAGLTAGVLVASAGAASANTIDFTGDYAPANWTFSAGAGNGGGSLATLLMSVTGNNNGSGGIFTEYTIAATSEADVSFHWAYDSVDTFQYDAGYFVINGVTTILAFNGPSLGSSYGLQTGFDTFKVQAGDVFGFGVWSADGSFGAGFLDVTEFGIKKQNLVPLPSVGLMGMAGLGGLATIRRRRMA